MKPHEGLLATLHLHNRTFCNRPQAVNKHGMAAQRPLKTISDCVGDPKSGSRGAGTECRTFRLILLLTLT